jgi:hypothetical protein
VAEIVEMEILYAGTFDGAVKRFFPTFPRLAIIAII